MLIDLPQILAEHRAAIDRVAELAAPLEEAVQMLRDTFAAGRRLFVCGNGGSAADAQHLAAELAGRFEKVRRGYPATALSTDTSVLTSIGNDYGFEHIFARQLEAQAVRGDLLVVISTSGHSPNLLHALAQARALGVRSIGLLGRDGGPCAQQVDLPLVVRASRTARIQEAHVLMLHVLCAGVEA